MFAEEVRGKIKVLEREEGNAEDEKVTGALKCEEKSHRIIRI
jgi:hypothetical protein